MNRLKVQKGQITTSIFVLFLFIVITNDALQFRTSYHGLDADPYCSSVMALQQGRDPYIMANYPAMPVTMHYTYMPVHLPVMRLACSLHSNHRLSVYIFQLSCIFMSLAYILYFIRKPQTIIWLFVIVLTGFRGFRAFLDTANMAGVEFSIFLASCCLIYRNNLFSAATGLGLMASLKLMPLSFISLFYMIKNISLLKKFQMVGISILSFAAMILISLTLFHTFFDSWLNSLFGQLPQASSIAEIWRGYEESSLFGLLVGGSLKSFLMSPQFSPLYFSTVLLLVGGYVWWIITSPPGKDGNDTFYVGLILLILLLPRLKPYTYLLATAPLFFYSLHLNVRNKITIFITACLLPYFIEKNSFSQEIRDYRQLISLGMTYIIILCKRSRPDSKFISTIG